MTVMAVKDDLFFKLLVVAAAAVKIAAAHDGRGREGRQVRAEIAGGTKVGEVSSEYLPGCREIWHQNWHQKSTTMWHHTGVCFTKTEWTG